MPAKTTRQVTGSKSARVTLLLTILLGLAALFGFQVATLADCPGTLICEPVAGCVLGVQTNSWPCCSANPDRCCRYVCHTCTWTQETQREVCPEQSVQRGYVGEYPGLACDQLPPTDGECVAGA